MCVDSTVIPRVFRWSAAATEADWDALYRAQLPRVYNFFRYRLGCTPDVEDLTATTFEKAWRARQRYRHDLASFSTWLLTIARNVAVDYERRRRGHLSLDAAAGVPSPDRSPEQAARLRSDVHRLETLLAGLPARDRELLALKYGGELTNRAIARATGLSESNVGTILHRTVQELRASWHLPAPQEHRDE